MVAQFGQQEWISQVQEGVARLVTTAIQQLAQSQGPAMNEQPLGAGGQYLYAPITEHNAQQHVAQNPAAHESHLGRPGNAQQANAAQAAYEAAQRAYAQAMQQQGVPQQVQGLQQATAGMDQFAQLAGVADPRQPQPQRPQQQGIILPPGVAPPQEGDDADDGSVSVLW